ncbi:MAG TPA: hypothetical protein VI758_01635 [Bacteroidota bacterium]
MGQFRSVNAFVVAVCLIPALKSQNIQQVAGERTSVDLTVYNSNMALIREERPITFRQGMNRIIVPEIPATIDGTSLHFASLSDPLSVRILEQNYQYDLVHQAKLLDKYIGRDIEFIRLDELTKKEYTVKAKLLATGWQPQPQYGGATGYVYSGQMIVEIGGKIEIAPPGRIELPSLSEGLILKPQLEWLVNSSRDGMQKTEISYIANGISWNCNYVALLNDKDSNLDLTGWVTLTNNSGTTFTNAGLKLVAGDVNRVQEGRGIMAQLAMKSDNAVNAPQFEQKELFEYKLYSLQRHTDLANSETKQIELTSGHNVQATRLFVYDGMADSWKLYYNNYSYRSQESFGQQANTKVGVYVTFRNDDKAGLGIPLPKGKVRVYKKDDDGKEQFVGEDEIDHTPKNEEVKLYLGNAFDIVGERKQTSFRNVVPGHMIEESFEIKLRNHKSETAEVQVYEHPWRWSDWEIVKQNTQWIKVDQTTINFPVKLKRDEEKTITYTIRYVW